MQVKPRTERLPADRNAQTLDKTLLLQTHNRERSGQPGEQAQADHVLAPHLARLTGDWALWRTPPQPTAS